MPAMPINSRKTPPRRLTAGWGCNPRLVECLRLVSPRHDIIGPATARIRSPKSLADVTVRCRHRLQLSLWAVVGSAEILARLVTLALGIETVNPDEILSGIGVSGTVTAGPMDCIVTARATAFGSVGAGSFGTDGGWDGTEGLCCCVFGCHGIWWLIGALAPADMRTLTPRRVVAREILNYFYVPKSGSFSPLNAKEHPTEGADGG